MFGLGHGRIFYGWWIVFACLVVAVVGWSLGTFGMGVYIHVLSEQRGFSIGLVSTAVTISYLISASCLVIVGTATARLGPKPVIATGAVVMAVTVAALGFCTEIWHVFAAFALMGIGRSCLSTTSISTTLAPWFEKHQGRAVSMALLGASVGGMIGTPLLLGGMALFSIETALVVAGLSAVVVLFPIVFLVLKRRPQELGLLPDGEAPSNAGATTIATEKWSRAGALATRQFHTSLSVLRSDCSSRSAFSAITFRWSRRFSAIPGHRSPFRPRHSPRFWGASRSRGSPTGSIFV